MKPDLLSVDRGLLLPSHMEELAKDFTVHLLPPPSGDRIGFVKPIADRIRFAQTTGAGGMKAELMDQLPKLEIVACVGVGVDAVDVPHAKKRGVKVTNTPDVLNDCVADLAFGLMIGASRRLMVADKYVRAGEWLQGSMPIASRVARKRLGILGLGKIGKAIAKRAAGFDMKIAYHGRKPQADMPYQYYADLAEMAANVDFLIVICPGGEATRHLVNEKVLRALGPKGVVVNVARGSVIDEEALVRVLKDGGLGGAALDVFQKEPNAPAELFTMDNVVLAPHVGSATFETRTDMGNLAIANLRAHLAGKPLLTPV